jgi:hypothetical protein
MGLPMNKGITKVLVKRVFKDQIWYETITIEQYYEQIETRQVQRNHRIISRQPSNETNRKEDWRRV